MNKIKQYFFYKDGEFSWWKSVQNILLIYVVSYLIWLYYNSFYNSSVTRISFDFRGSAIGIILASILCYTLIIIICILSTFCFKNTILKILIRLFNLASFVVILFCYGFIVDICGNPICFLNPFVFPAVAWAFILIFKKSNGAYLYASTDIATILQRMEDFHPNHILYVTDNRQEMHFTQVFRVCDKTGICSIKKLEHLGYGTVNGEDGKPYKTRNGDTPKLSALFQNARDIFISKKEDNKAMSIEDVDKIVNAILKFADLQNSREKDYIFDLEKFSEVTGKTGPYILYTYLRLNRIIMAERIPKGFTNEIYNEFDRDLRLQILELPNALQAAYDERKPNYIAEYVYNLCVCANAFYQHNNVNKEENQAKKDDYIYVLKTTTDIIRELLHLLIIEIPTKM